MATYVAYTSINMPMTGPEVVAVGTREECAQADAFDPARDIYEDTRSKNFKIVSMTEFRRRFGRRADDAFEAFRRELKLQQAIAESPEESWE